MVLEVRGLVKHFGGVTAVQGVDLEVRPGECVALIGPNGAGKSTTFACIAGQHPVTSGTVHWCGQPLHALAPAQRLALGVARTFQVAQVFEALPVLQNLQLALLRGAGLRSWDRLDQHAPAAALALLSRVGLQAAATRPTGDLPYGAKKRLELAIALAGVAAAVGPALLLLDEPAAGLAPAERADLMRLVQSLAKPDHGPARFAVLYTEHNMDAVFGVADRVLVLIEGVLAAQGTPREVANSATVRARYLGRTQLNGLETGDA